MALCKGKGREQRELHCTNEIARVRQSCDSGEVEEKVDEQILALEFRNGATKFRV